MEFHFLQRAQIDEKIYPLGVHDVPEKHVKHHYFKLLQKSGLVIAPDARVKPGPSLDERKLAMAEKVLANPSTPIAEISSAKVEPKEAELAEPKKSKR